MKDKQERLENLKNKLTELALIVEKSFKTDKDLEVYRKKNITQFNEYFDVSEEIQQLEYELMTTKEKEEYDEYLRLLKLKAEGKLPLG